MAKITKVNCALSQSYSNRKESEMRKKITKHMFGIGELKKCISQRTVLWNINLKILYLE